MQQWWWTLIPVVAVAVGYVIRRRLEGRARAEGLKRKLQALALHNGMKRSGLTLDELSRLERDATD